VPPPVRAGAAFGLAFRPEREADEAFLATLYASTRADEVAAFGWPAEMQAGFLDLQRRAQQAHFRRAYPNAEWLIVEQAGRPIGRLYIEVNDEVVHGVDIALLPECRGSGVGGAVMQDLIDYGRDLGRKISVFVEHGNPAAHLYERLGFAPVPGEKQEGVYTLYVWRPEGAAEGG
jgi:GNAT superfamily N-acetyltransferase